MRLRNRFLRLASHRSLRSLIALACVVAASPAHASFASLEREGDGGVFPAGADGRETTVPSLAAYRLRPGENVRVDGRLDDACWLRAPTGAGFSQWDPDRGAAPSEETMFKVAFDGSAVYFAVACREKDLSKIAQTLSRRDDFNDTDFVSVFIDPYFDKTTGYNFRVNPLGVQQDRYVYDDGDTDRDWDAVWEAETFVDSDGWYAEIRVPFSSFRYRADAPMWGLQVRRWMHGRGEDSSWSTWDRDTSGFVSRFGTLTGISDLGSPRQLEVVPYTVYSQTDPSTQGTDELDSFSNLGLDLKYGVNSAYTLNATIQPDFGQVELDPAVLNLSPFETFFQEKRPFFVEGSRYFQHPEFNLFYSRRIGTGEENSRIRFAGKLTGKSSRGTSVGLLAAATDVTADGQAHNPFVDGESLSRYYVGRVGQEFSEGRHQFNVMGTSVDYTHRDRDAATAGVDFSSRFFDRQLRVSGAWAGSRVSPEPTTDNPNPGKRYGTGGEFSINRSGKTSLGTWGRWESDELSLNDAGFLGSPDEAGSGAWASFDLSQNGEDRAFNNGNLNFNYWVNWLYAGRTGYDLHSGDRVWSYGRGHQTGQGGNVNGWVQFRNYWEGWFGVSYNYEGTQRYHTRSRVTLLDGDRAAIPGGGPLISEPETFGFWWGGNTDTRRPFTLNLSGDLFWDVADNVSTSVNAGADWTVSSAFQVGVDAGYGVRIDDTQHLENFENLDGGIGGVSYVFGEIDQRTFDVTLRANVLFGRNTSLEFYAQPFITVADYTNARELVTPDTYRWTPYTTDGFQASDRDFRFKAANVNSVFRWQYRPGSTLFVVWTHSRAGYAERRFSSDPVGFDNGLDPSTVLDDEAENVFLMKLSYWLPL